jgi:hypothetical protein
MALGGLLSLLAATNGCSSVVNAVNQVQSASEGCNGLDTADQAQATVKAFADAVTALTTASAMVEAKWLTVCNEINADLGLDTTRATASGRARRVHRS